MNIVWNTFKLLDHYFIIAKTNKGVCLIDQYNNDDKWKGIMLRKFSNCSFTQDSLKDEIEEVQAYIFGERTSFTFPIDMRGTRFQEEVWQAASKVSYGHTKTYQAIAEDINRPKAARAVGAALGANCILFAIPCHRIIAQSKKLTGYRGGVSLKKHILQLEKANDQ